MSRRTLSDSEVLAHHKNRHAQRQLNEYLDQIQHAEVHVKDTTREEVQRLRDFQRETVRTSGWSPQAMRPDTVHEVCMLDQSGWPLGKTGLRPLVKEVSEDVKTFRRPWLYAFNNDTHNKMYTEQTQASKKPPPRTPLYQDVTSRYLTSAPRLARHVSAATGAERAKAAWKAHRPHTTHEARSSVYCDLIPEDDDEEAMTPDATDSVFHDQSPRSGHKGSRDSGQFARSVLAYSGVRRFAEAWVCTVCGGEKMKSEMVPGTGGGMRRTILQAQNVQRAVSALSSKVQHSKMAVTSSDVKGPERRKCSCGRSRSGSQETGALTSRCKMSSSVRLQSSEAINVNNQRGSTGYSISTSSMETTTVSKLGFDKISSMRESEDTLNRSGTVLSNGGAKQTEWTCGGKQRSKFSSGDGSGHTVEKTEETVAFRRAKASNSKDKDQINTDIVDEAVKKAYEAEMIAKEDTHAEVVNTRRSRKGKDKLDNFDTTGYTEDTKKLSDNTSQLMSPKTKSFYQDESDGKAYDERNAGLQGTSKLQPIAHSSPKVKLKLPKRVLESLPKDVADIVLKGSAESAPKKESNPILTPPIKLTDATTFIRSPLENSSDSQSAQQRARTEKSGQSSDHDTPCSNERPELGQSAQGVECGKSLDWMTHEAVISPCDVIDLITMRTIRRHSSLKQGSVDTMQPTRESTPALGITDPSLNNTISSQTEYSSQQSGPRSPLRIPTSPQSDISSPQLISPIPKQKSEFKRLMSSESVQSSSVRSRSSLASINHPAASRKRPSSIWRLVSLKPRTRLQDQDSFFHRVARVMLAIKYHRAKERQAAQGGTKPEKPEQSQVTQGGSQASGSESQEARAERWALGRKCWRKTSVFRNASGIFKTSRLDLGLVSDEGNAGSDRKGEKEENQKSDTQPKTIRDTEDASKALEGEFEDDKEMTLNMVSFLRQGDAQVRLTSGVLDYDTEDLSSTSGVLHRGIRIHDYVPPQARYKNARRKKLTTSLKWHSSNGAEVTAHACRDFDLDVVFPRQARQRELARMVEDNHARPDDTAAIFEQIALRKRIDTFLESVEPLCPQAKNDNPF